jgi:hypothetical protein
VYSVLAKDDEGSFSTLSKYKDFSFAERVIDQMVEGPKKREEAGFLIYVITQEVLFNDEISTITYFKDITFGILYEQIKVQN